jgi:hypothetical protein
MAQFYLDEDVSPQVGQLLAAQGHDYVHARDLGNRGMPDPQHLLVAANAGRVLVTFNRRDFGPLHQFWTALNIWGTLDRRHAGILSSWGQIPIGEWAGLNHDFMSPEPALDNQCGNGNASNNAGVALVGDAARPRPVDPLNRP